MQNNFSDYSEEAIRITNAEANSTHVDSLLKRQMSLKGESGITRSHKRRWYYQNWFVFMIAGIIAAVAAWAILEPYFNDLYYFQGVIDDINFTSPTPSQFHSGDSYFEPYASILGYVQIKGKQIWLLDGAKELLPDGSIEPFDISSLRQGEEIGVYLSYYNDGQIEVSLASFVELSPPPQSAGQKNLTLSQLDAQHTAAGILLFPLVAGFIGLAIGSVDGIVCRTLKRALLCGFVGFLVGFIGGFLSGILAGFIYMPLNNLAMEQIGDSLSSINPFGFFVQMTGRGLAWCFAGIAMGLGQGIVMRSKRLLLYGFLGGIIGGLIGGLLFDPIDFLIIGIDKPSSHISRLIGFSAIGACVGCMIGIVELLARDAWLQMIKGPLAGKEFLIFKDIMKIGASSRCDIYLFNDKKVSDVHAMIRVSGDTYEIQNFDEENPLQLNGRPVKSSRLRSGDRITIGQTDFVFQARK